jgi:hypothetical protein
MSFFNLVIWGYGTIVFLTGVLVGMNIHAEFAHLLEHKNRIRFYSYMGTLLMVGSVIIVISGQVVDHVIDSELSLKSDTPRGTPRTH